jgi:hypothetical protein
VTGSSISCFEFSGVITGGLYFLVMYNGEM